MLNEGKTLELKREYVEDIKNTVVAFANCDGGEILIGVEDDGSVCGVVDVDAVMQRVTNAIRDSVRPDVTLFAECSTVSMDEKTVVRITVQRGTARPYYLHGKGIRPEGVYVRQGASTVPATDSAILKMIKETSGDSFERSRSLNQQLTFDKTLGYFSKKGVELGSVQMKTLKMIGEDGTYTNLAYLLSDQNAQTIKLAVFEGDKKTVFKDRHEVDGSLLKQLEDAYEYIDRYNRTRSEFLGLDRIDIRDYPTEAVREALLNAMVHRDYSFSSSTLVSIFDDRMEFVTVGGLVKGVTLNDIKLGVSVLRNTDLANIFYRLKLIEAYGTGIMKIFTCYEEYGYEPKIEASDNAFKLTLPNINFAKEKKSVTCDQSCDLSEEEKIIKEYCEKQGFILRCDVQNLFKISQSSAINLLGKYVEKGFLVKIGNGRKIKYCLNDQNV